MKIRIAELNVEIFHRYPYVERLCRDYAAQFDKADITASVTDEEITEELRLALSADGITKGVAEATCIYRQIALQLPLFDAFVFHAAVVECDGEGYAFAAASGVGKSTHVALWRKLFGHRARIINGDKPILRFLNGRLMAFGTPWQGKENWGTNASTPLKAVCFLERGAENKIGRMDEEEAVGRLFSQVLMPAEQESALRFLGLLDRVVCETPLYLLRCNTDPTAAQIAHDGMKKEI